MKREKKKKKEVFLIQTETKKLPKLEKIGKGKEKREWEKEKGREEEGKEERDREIQVFSSYKNL